jgi:hypothetical protein
MGYEGRQQQNRLSRMIAHRVLLAGPSGGAQWLNSSMIAAIAVLK